MNNVETRHALSDEPNKSNEPNESSDRMIDEPNC